MSFSEESDRIYKHKLSRRFFLKLGMLTAVASVSPCPAFAAISDFLSAERSLSIYNIHTGERLNAVYWSGGKYSSKPLVEINYILRDHRTGEVRSIDTRLLDLLYAISLRVKSRHPFHIISGYRSPSTNALLRKRDGDVAKKSLHMYGKAVDIDLPGCELAELRRAAMDLKAAGVGYYPRHNFVHIDVGPVRYW
jgi:uncharacterized protein YcbK (DUF882 family)